MSKVSQLFDIEGKRAVITGGAQGMGRAVVRGFAEAGAIIAILDVRPDVGEVAGAVAGETQGQVYGVRADLSSSKERRTAFAKALELLGGIDILVNCAGIQYAEDIVDFSEEAWHKVLSVNLDATFELCQLAGREMIAQRSGKIINFASMLSFIGGTRVPAYSASKGAVMQITKTMSNDWAQYHVCVNAVAPGYMDTPLNTGFMKNEERSSFIFSRIPARRWGQPEDIVGAVLLLASPASDYITGAVIPVDGGFIAN